MSVLNFDANTSRTPTTRSNAQQDRPAAKLWLNLGYDANGRFVNLPVGIAVDTMEPRAIRGQNEEWAMFESARNELLKAIIEAGDGLEPGAEIELKLTVKLRKVKEELDITSNDNPFTTNFSNIFGGSKASIDQDELDRIEYERQQAEEAARLKAEAEAKAKTKKLAAQITA